MRFLQDRAIGTKLLLAFSLIIAVMITSSVFLYERLAFIEDSTGWASHTHEVLDELHGMVTAMVNQETGVRGFLVSGDAKFLEPYNAGKADFKRSFDRARQLTADNAKQQQRLNDVAALADDWANGVAEKEIALMSKPDTADRARALESSGAGKKSMDGIRAKIGEMVSEETSLLLKRDAAQADAFSSSRTTIYFGGALSVLVATALSWLLNVSVTRVIVMLTRAMTRLAEGDTATEVPSRDRRDEIGTMAGAVQVFKDNMIEAERLRGEQEELKRRSEHEKKMALRTMADAFEASVRGIVNGVSSSAVELQSSAETMSGTAEETASQAATVAAASEQARTNVQTVAAATEELSSSISEISRQVTDSARVCGSAVAGAERARQSIQEMEETAQKISTVVTLINSIAGQTNLLALNATIEAARAGEAGKGFAVVASEVKSLANQTAKATEEISAQVKAVQRASAESVRVIEEISVTIGNIDEIATSIASAVEEQGVATQEIARNVQQAALGTNEVSTNIEGVSTAAAETGSAATQVLGAASELSQQSEALRGQVDQFLATVRAA